MGEDSNNLSLLWESEESCKEWRGSLYSRDKGYIEDLNLKLVYEEVCRAGRFGAQYNFEEIFLHPCARASTVAFRQRIMEQLYQDAFLYEAALDFVSCVSEIQQRLERFGGKTAQKNEAAERAAMAREVAAARKAALAGNLAVGKEAADSSDGKRDENKKMIAALQIRHCFLASLKSISEKVSGYIKKGTPLSACAERLAEFVSDGRTVPELEELSEFLSVLDGVMPQSVLLNKDRGQNCRSIVIDPEGTRECGYTERLIKCAEPFLGKYDFKIRVYQNTDISHLDKRIQEHVCHRHPRLADRLKNLYEKYGDYDISYFAGIAEELVFYLACIRFVRRYEEAGFFFSMPVCTGQQESEVTDAYDMTLGINLYRNNRGGGAVPNDYGFAPGRRIFILTGANQGGKTTFIRSVGLIQCLAQIGMYVPCRRASLGMVGQIHTHFSREDESGATVGRFEQELQRIQEILKTLRDGDMILLNETFTSTQRTVAVVLLKRLLRELDCRHCCGGLVTHFYEVGDGLEGEGFYSLVTEVAGEGESRERTFKIREGESFRYSFAKDIAVKCGVTYEGLAARCGLPPGSGTGQHGE